MRAVLVALAGLMMVGCGSRAHPPRVVSISVHGVTAAADTATGFAVGADRVVTVAHVIEPGRVVVVRTGDGHSHRAHVVRLDERDDLALLAVRGVSAAGIRIRTGVLGKTRLMLPHATLAATVTRHVSATMRSPNAPRYVRPALELRARVGPGDSGAPVVDRSGAVGGVLFARSEGRPATAWAVDATALKHLLKPKAGKP